MTAPTFQAVTTAGDSNAQGVTVTRASTTTDDVNIVDLYYESGVDPTTGLITFANGSWTLSKSTVQAGSTPDFTHVRYREKYASGGSTVAITWLANIGSVWRSVICTAYRGVDTTTAEDVATTGAASGTSSASATAPTLTTVTGDAMIVYCETDLDGNTVTSPTGTTPTFAERSDFANLQVADGPLATAGATGAKTGTLAVAAWNTASLMALRPAVPGGAAAPIPRRAVMVGQAVNRAGSY